MFLRPYKQEGQVWQQIKYILICITQIEHAIIALQWKLHLNSKCYDACSQ